MGLGSYNLGGLGYVTLAWTYVPKWSDAEIRDVIGGTDPNTRAPRPFNTDEYSQGLIDAVIAEATKRKIAMPSAAENIKPPAKKSNVGKMVAIAAAGVGGLFVLMMVLKRRKK